MKTAIPILILSFLAISCESQELNLTYNNVEINIPGRPGPWLKYGDNFYCFFQTDNDKFSSASNHHFYILNRNGGINAKVEVPNEIQKTYYDLYVKNDTIFTTEYYDHNTFYLDRTNETWVKTEKGIDLYFEDKY